jgi:8-amino-7-oxononanoate synthase
MLTQKRVVNPGFFFIAASDPTRQTALRMSDFPQALRVRLDDIRASGLHRELRRVDSPQGTRIVIGGKTLLNFSSNDYLGLANHPALKEAAAKAVSEFGAGSGASRLICGSLSPHHELEEAIAAFKVTEAALSFSSGYATVVGTICALVGKGDVIIVDKLVHACIVDAARLSGAKLRVFAHNDLNDLEDKLKWAVKAKAEIGKQRAEILIATESIFSMDGDCAPLREIVALKEQYGAWLMLDEAHATGLHGENSRGLAEETGVAEQVEIQMGTLGKALGAGGGYVCGSRLLIELLVNRARSFIFSTAPVPAAAAAATAGIRVVQSSEGRKLQSQLWQNVRAFAPDSRSAIVPIIIGDEQRTLECASQLREQDIFIPAIRYPTVARGSARLRVTLSAAHTAGDLSALTEALSLVEIVKRKT